jgi:acyl carrier protein
LDEKQVSLRSSFVEDLLVDSIRMVDLMLRLEEMGVVFPPEAAWEIVTVEDAYRCYVDAISAREEPSTGEAPARATTG